jgi:putative sterol carrier protein
MTENGDERSVPPGEGNKVSVEPEQAERMDGQEPKRVSRHSHFDRRRSAGSVEELLESELEQRLLNANVRLREQLMGSIVVALDSGKRYLVEASAEQTKVSQTESESADCVIQVSGSTLLRIAAGDLNPQIAMLSDKINVRGRLSLAVYFFNLIVPQSSLERADRQVEGRSVA